MHSIFARAALIAFAAALVAPSAAPVGAQSAESSNPPEVSREFRGVWVATVANIDWPSKPGLTSAQQQDELRTIMDRAQSMHLNAVIFQVRAATDAFYASRLEPWSEYISGVQGRAPDPFYDPLELAVTEAHRRGLELHAWINPYRARHSSAKSAIDSTHVSRRKPGIVRNYGRSLWLDPGEPATLQHSLDVVLDIVKRYDVDGVHIDDYFYPYKERDSSGALIAFPDDSSFARYVRGGGKLGRDDWRRDNVDRFVQQMYGEVKRAKPWVKVGISPFGIWRPGNPASIKGFDAYQELYADSRKWLQAGWVDYWTPQLYWPIAQAPQSYPVLLRWWSEQNVQHRNLWPGNYTSGVGGPGSKSWQTSELTGQILSTRAQPGATGNVHFSMKPFLLNRIGLSDTLAKGLYAEPALVPASPWLDSRAPGQPRVAFRVDSVPGTVSLSLDATAGAAPWQWVVQSRVGRVWRTEILQAPVRGLVLARDGAAAPDEVLVAAVSRTGVTGPSLRATAPTRASRGLAAQPASSAPGLRTSAP